MTEHAAVTGACNRGESAEMSSTPRNSYTDADGTPTASIMREGRPPECYTPPPNVVPHTCENVQKALRINILGPFSCPHECSNFRLKPARRAVTFTVTAAGAIEMIESYCIVRALAPSAQEKARRTAGLGRNRVANSGRRGVGQHNLAGRHAVPERAHYPHQTEGPERRCAAQGLFFV